MANYLKTDPGLRFCMIDNITWSSVIFENFWMYTVID